MTNIIASAASVGGVLVLGVLVLVLSLVVAMGLIKQKKRNIKSSSAKSNNYSSAVLYPSCDSLHCFSTVAVGPKNNEL